MDRFKTSLIKAFALALVLCMSTLVLLARVHREWLADDRDGERYLIDSQCDEQFATDHSRYCNPGTNKGERWAESGAIVDLPPGKYEAYWYFKIENTTYQEGKDAILKLDVHDWTSPSDQGTTVVLRKDFGDPNVQHRFHVDFTVNGEATHKMEARARWTGAGHVWFYKVGIADR